MEWNWKEKREKRAFLALEDGTIYRGHAFGARNDHVGEVVFNTGMTGYQEIISDPSYSGQFVTMTYPEIGNTGINSDDFESRGVFLRGLIIHELNPPSNWRSTETLDHCLQNAGVPAIAGIDTRALTSKLRSAGTLKGYLSVSGDTDEAAAIAAAQEWEGLDGQDYAAKVTCQTKYGWDPDGSASTSWGMGEALPPVQFRIAAYDFGIKWNILRHLRLCGIDTTVVPATTTAADVLSTKPDAVFYSNGPADPAAVQYAIDNARELIGKVPLMGICLGHQLLGLACGAATYRLKFGHHGCNHPVMELSTRKVEITSQNHNFALDPDTIANTPLEVTHINLNDDTIEGIRHRSEPLFAVQYHPESGPGPHDPHYLFDRFRELLTNA